MDLRRRNFPLVLALAAAFVTPIFGQSEGAESIPDFSGIWIHANPGFEPLASGPTFVKTKVRPSFLRMAQHSWCNRRTRSPSFMYTRIRSVRCA